MQHARRLLPLALAVLLLVAAPADAAGAPAKCARAGSATIAKSSAARVYEVDVRDYFTDTELYGCLYSRNKPVWLADAYDDNYVTNNGYRSVRLAGRYVAFTAWYEDNSCKAACPPGYDSRDDWVAVWDLAARKRRVQPALVAGGTLRLNDRGMTAWLQRLGGGQREVHFWNVGGHRVLDTGPIRSASLVLTGSTLSWVNGDVQHNVQLR